MEEADANIATEGVAEGATAAAEAQVRGSWAAEERRARAAAHELADDYAGLEQFLREAAAGKRPAPRKVIATAGASAVDVLRSVLSTHLVRVIDLLRASV